MFYLFLLAGTSAFDKVIDYKKTCHKKRHIMTLPQIYSTRLSNPESIWDILQAMDPATIEATSLNIL